MRVGIALGSNLGDRAVHLQAAVHALRALALPPILISRVYETEPVDCPPGSGNFLNAAMEIGWSGELYELLRRLQTLEKEMGRPDFRDRNSPRPIDLDILYAGDLECNDPELLIPHPRLSERLFVLAPLSDIVPTLCLPSHQKNIREQFDDLSIRLTDKFFVSKVTLN